jgi:ESS family glutamate:Na+ symporter
MLIELSTPGVLVVSIFALWLGATINKRSKLLHRFSFPAPVTGGVLCAVVLSLLDLAAGVDVRWDLELRDELLLVFFTGVGLSAKFSNLRRGGSLFAKLTGFVVLFLILQNALGIAVAFATGRPPMYGLVSGSIAFSGGHGTAVTWGRIAADWGYPDVLAHGLAYATVGLIVGGIMGGPVADWLIRRNNLAEPKDLHGLRGQVGSGPDAKEFALSSRRLLLTILVFSICVAAGSKINTLLDGVGFVVPGFVTAMLAGVLLTNLVDLLRVPLHDEAIELIGDVSLQLFLAMSLVSLELTHLLSAIIPLTLAVSVQAVLAVSFAVWVVFPGCGRDYDASVISAGFVGIGLGATPVGMANMEAVTKRFGPAPRALLVLPLIGAGVLDLANAIVIDTYLKFLR